MIITKKVLPRRTVLRGLGATLALPFLDAMVPALTAQEKTAARRLSIVYVPNGIATAYWTPVEQGAQFTLTPTLQPLAAFRDRLTVLSGLDAKEANPQFGEGVGDHARAGAVFLTGVHPKPTASMDIRAAVSMDQIAAHELAQETQLASLELGLDPDYAGTCDGNYSCAYVNTISWRTPTTPMPMEVNPRVVFERMFGDSTTTDPAARRARFEQDRSILDAVSESTARMAKSVGPSDATKLTEYLDAIRDVERRVQKATAQNMLELPTIERPVGVPATFEEHAKLMYDLQVLALQADLTRVITFMMGREVTYRAYPEIGVPDAHHPLSHHDENPQKIAKLAKINAYHTEMLAHYLQRLQATPDGDGTLLDHVTILYGGGISNSNAHLHTDLPILLFDRSSKLSGQHVRYPAGTPLTNLHLTLLYKLGIQVEKIGDSTGRFAELSGV
jgi:hypothetical protein